MNNISPYERLYFGSYDHCLWGDEPGRLIKFLDRVDHGNKILDIGCGDGKNSLYFEQKGCLVTGVDNSINALLGLSNRFQRLHRRKYGTYIKQDIREFHSQPESFDILVSYGLYHCLPDSGRLYSHRKLQDLVRVGGLMLFTCLTDDLPMPSKHGTGKIFLTTQDEIIDLFDKWEIIHFSFGVISESHKPIIGLHHHSAVWVIARRL